MELHRLTNFTEERIAFCKGEVNTSLEYDEINRQRLNDFLDGLETWKEIKKTLNSIKDCPIEEKAKLVLHLRKLALPMLDKIMERSQKLYSGISDTDTMSDTMSEEVDELLKKHSIQIASDIEEMRLIYQELEGAYNSILPFIKP